MLRFHNTLSGTVDDFHPLEQGLVRMYNCGPTVYGLQHIGNLSMFVFTDVLRRSLIASGYEVKQVINFTDFGHLASDADEGEDKMSKGLRAEGLEPTLENMHRLGEKYASIFLEDIKKLNILTDGVAFPYASQYVPEQIKLIKTLEEKGFTYAGAQGVYFDTSKFPDYGKLGHINLSGLKEGARIGENSERKNPTDFLLWKSGEMGWESPWGKGFPGWHIECSAMILSLLGEQIDIHTGGIEHIPVHHQNEIAQSEAATGKAPFSRFWLHRAHLQIDGAKIAKSEGNVVYLSEVIEKGFSPLALRYLLLQSHYRTPTNFTWESLQAAQNALRKLKQLVSALPEGGSIDETSKAKFSQSIEDDLNTPEALGSLWNLVKDDSISPADKRATLLEIDNVLGLDLSHNEFAVGEVPEKVQILLTERETARSEKNWSHSDKLRDEIRNLGYEVLDTDSGQTLRKL